MLAYFFPLFGAIIADGFLGKYKTTIYISMIYATGGIVLSLAAITPLGLPHRELSLLGEKTKIGEKKIANFCF